MEFRAGDILVIRTGMTEVLDNLTTVDLVKMRQAKLSGLHGTEETAAWVWNKRFSAVAGGTLRASRLGRRWNQTGPRDSRLTSGSHAAPSFHKQVMGDERPCGSVIDVG